MSQRKHYHALNGGAGCTGIVEYPKSINMIIHNLILQQSAAYQAADDPMDGGGRATQEAKAELRQTFFHPVRGVKEGCGLAPR